MIDRFTIEVLGTDVVIEQDSSLSIDAPTRITITAKTSAGIPTAALRRVPMRFARTVMARALSREIVAQRVGEWRVEDFRTDQDWAKLAMACAMLSESGVTNLGAALRDAWPTATAAVWNSRIHRLRESNGGRGYLVSDNDGRLMLSPEALRLALAVAPVDAH